MRPANTTAPSLRFMSSGGTPPDDDAENGRTRAITIGIMITLVVACTANLFYGPKMTLGEIFGAQSADIDFQRRFLRDRELDLKREADARAR